LIKGQIHHILPPVDFENWSVVNMPVNSRTLLSARIISETLGASIEWDEEMQTVIITAE